MRGSSFEGLSIRDVIYNQEGKIVGWGAEPVLGLSPTVAEVVKELIEAVREYDLMLEATKKPIIDEAKLEAIMRRKNNQQ